jgi:hypothetical protein
MQGTSVIQKSVENDSCTRIFVESKIIINSNQNIGSNITNSNKNIMPNKDKRKKKEFFGV